MTQLFIESRLFLIQNLDNSADVVVYALLNSSELAELADYRPFISRHGFAQLSRYKSVQADQALAGVF